MIFESYIQSINEKTIPVNLDLFDDIDGNPFEYMVGAAYECSYMEKQINLMAIGEEYEYLREYGTVEPIHEANIIVKVFTAIKEAIATVFRKICEFFKSLFHKAEETTSDSKKKINTINANKSKKIESQFKLSYIEINDLEEIATTLEEIPEDITKEVAPGIATVFGELTKELINETPDQRREELKSMQSSEYKKLVQLVDYINDDHVVDALKMFTDLDKNVVDIIEKLEKGEGLRIMDLPHTVVDISNPDTVGQAAKDIQKGMNYMQRIKDSLTKSFNICKKCIALAKDSVTKSETYCNQVLNRLARERNDSTLSDATKIISETAKYANIALNFIDKWLVKLETAATKLIMEQMDQYKKAVTALAAVAGPALPGPTA